MVISTNNETKHVKDPNEDMHGYSEYVRKIKVEYTNRENNKVDNKDSRKVHITMHKEENLKFRENKLYKRTMR